MSVRGKPRFQTCRHCRRQVPRTRRRDLCWRCYYTPAVRRLYPPVSKFAAYRNDVSAGRRLCPPRTPTDAMPGTAEKVTELAVRAQRNEHLWHSGDRRIDLR